MQWVRGLKSRAAGGLTFFRCEANCNIVGGDGGGHCDMRSGSSLGVDCCYSSTSMGGDSSIINRNTQNCFGCCLLFVLRGPAHAKAKLEVRQG